MKPVVVRSLNDADAVRCVDILRRAEDFGWVECRRDPEDATGWRRLGETSGGFASAEAAQADAARCVGWLEQA